jgi:hypothetical protein
MTISLARWMPVGCDLPYLLKHALSEVEWVDGS